ncbi:uncharacterized protein LOC126743011 [Anthonomus grandis grandis]|uniref:uncharacterized protein LOC126743011 n=1 Tax=Anthonomus grandis grandis TaxID=2921223 RepID=UPI002165CA10|nr:uncharacterized protein LOC126743011 [Anthonomus grandis grandis]
MPRIYKKKLGPQGKCNYDQEYIRRAVAAVRRGDMSMRQASERFGVPFSSIQRRYHGKHSLKYGRQPVLSGEQELRLKETIKICADWGFPLKSTDVRAIVQQYLNRLGVRDSRFKENMPGMDWFKSFMSRNKDLTVKLAENTKRVRGALTREVIQKYFENLQVTLKDVPAQNIINYDETNFVDDPGSAKVITKRGAKHAHRLIDSSKTSTTVMFAIAADGTLLPPYTVYKAKHSYDGWTEGGIEGARYNRSMSGWFDSDIFEDWFKTIVMPYFRKLAERKVLIGDNLNCHITTNVVQQCENNEIDFVLLPPNSTHLLQPLDVAYFRPLKAAWRSTLEQWKLKHRGVIPKTEFPRLLRQSVEKIGIKSKENSIAGFKACGIFPLDPNKVLNKIPRNLHIEENGENNDQAWSNTIISHLKNLKTTPNQSTKRGKKIIIEAGKSVSSQSLLSTIIDKTPTKKSSKKNMKKNERRALEISDDELDRELDKEFSLGDFENIVENFDEFDPNPSTSNDDTYMIDTDLSMEPRIGEFIIAKFPTEKRDRLFVGKIENCSKKKEFTINAMRKKGNSEKGCFVYPEIQDLCLISQDQIIRKLRQKSFKRGKFVFNLDNDEFKKLE